MMIMGACDRTTSTPEAASTTTVEPSEGDGRDVTGTQGDRRSPPARKPKASDPFAEGFVAAHNQVRSQVSPAAKSPLPDVTWSADLAKQAQAWADRCDFNHSKSDLGENLSARTDVADPSEIVAAWAIEAEGYDYAHNRCAQGKACGHYTQVVWRDSIQIGCGMAQCETGSPFGTQSWVFWVCNYSPAGNWQGERPY